MASSRFDVSVQPNLQSGNYFLFFHGAEGDTAEEMASHEEGEDGNG